MEGSVARAERRVNGRPLREVELDAARAGERHRRVVHHDDLGARGEREFGRGRAHAGRTTHHEHPLAVVAKRVERLIVSPRLDRERDSIEKELTRSNVCGKSTGDASGRRSRSRSARGEAGSRDDEVRGSLLRPVRLRHRLRPVSGVATAPRGGAALLQRALRLLRAEPLRRRETRPRRLEDVQLRARDLDRGDQERDGDPSRVHHLRGPGRARRSSWFALTGLHSPEDPRPRTPDPRPLRPVSRPARRRRRVRLCRRSRGEDAHACDRHAPRVPRRGPGVVP